MIADEILSKEQKKSVPDRYQPDFDRILRSVEEFPESDNPADLIRDLMKSADSLLSTYSQKNETQPQALQTLDELLWEWFQEPPSSERFSDAIDDVLRDVHKALVSDESSGMDREENRETAENGTVSDEASTETSSSQNTPQDEENDLILELDVDLDMLEDFLMEAEDELQTLENLMIEVEENPNDDQLNRLYRAMHTLKGGFGFCNLENCSEVTHAAEDLLDNLREDPPEEINGNWMELLLSSVDFIRLMLSGLQKALEDENNKFSTDLSRTYVNRLKQDLAKAAEGKKRSDDFETLTMDDATGTEDNQSIANDQVKVDLNTIDEVVDLIGELVISKSELDQQLNGDRDRQTDQILSKQQKIMNKLQRKSMDMRMLPIKREFRKFPRVVRDLADELDKQVDLIIEGETTEIDKTILDGLEGPLMHLVRNAVDHGIETPHEREQKGKPREAQLEIRAYHESGQVYVEVEDDGRGLPTKKIETKAIEQGLIEEDHNLSEGQIHEQILKPGFSTADQVTDVSGRGVGLDVVATEIESLQGSVMIDSETDEGTKFTLELPLTVAIIDGLVTRIGQETFIIPANQIEESINPEPDDLETLQDRGRVLQYREHIVPVVDPLELLDGQTGHSAVEDRTILVVVEASDTRFAVWVDELKSHQQIVIKQMEGHDLKDANLTSGGAILGDGSVGLILDLNGLARRCLDQAENSSPQSLDREETNVEEPTER